jgi:hypothetical protein
MPDRPRRRTPVQRLIARLEAMGVPLPPDPVVRRTYAGRHQQSAGHPSWCIVPGGDDHGGWTAVVVSQYPVTELLRMPRLCASRAAHDPDIYIDPYDGLDPIVHLPLWIAEAPRTPRGDRAGCTV